MAFKNEFSIIESHMDNNIFVQKHPEIDFNSGSILVVRESQEAIFFLNGEALDLFGPGRHELTTQNLPMLSRVFAKAFGEKTVFKSEIYFINTTEHLGIKWGTDSQLEYTDPIQGFPVKLGARGELCLRVEDPRKLLIKVIGAESELTNMAFDQSVKSLMMPYIKQLIARYIVDNKIAIFDIDLHLVEMSDALFAAIRGITTDYGIELTKFAISGVMKPEDDPLYQKFKALRYKMVTDVGEAKVEASKRIIEAQSMAEKRRLEGYTYESERRFDVMEALANNQGDAGAISNLGTGLGMMLGVGLPLGNAVGNAVNEAIAPTEKTTVKSFCTNCGAELSKGAKFCPECGIKIEAKDRGHCPSCGAIRPDGAKFCSECGAKLE